MKINYPPRATVANATPNGHLPATRPPSVRLSASSTRLAATAAGNAVAGSAVGLAFFLSRKPTPAFDSYHAKFRA